MKTMVKAAAFVTMLFIILAVMFDVFTATSNRHETAQLAEKSSYESVKAVKNKSKKVTTDKEMAEEAIRQVLLNKRSNSDIKVDVISVDSKNGMADVRVTETFKHANSKKETVAERRTVILN